MKLKVFFIEIVIVIIGVSVAFFGETKRQKYINKQSENRYIKALKIDLSYNKEQTKARFSEDSTQIVLLNKLITNLQNKKFKTDSLDLALTNLLKVNKISFQKTTYQEIVNRGDMSVILNDSIRRMIIDYFDFYNNVRFQEDHSMKMLSEFIIPYVNSNFSINDINKKKYSELNSTRIKDDEFYNLVYMTLEKTSYKMNIYNRFIAKHNRLISAINKNYN